MFQILAALGIRILLSSTPAFAAAYTITDLGGFGGGFTEPTAINDKGQIAGFSYYSDQITARPFLYSGGSLQDLGTLGGRDSRAAAINASGQIVGSSTTSTAPFSSRHAFLYSGGSIMDLETLPGSHDTRATGINASGQIVGNSDSNVFVYSNGNMQILGKLGALSIVANGINDSGAIVGYLYRSGQSGYHAFVYSGGVTQDLGTLGGSEGALAYGINNSGQVVGAALGVGGASEGAALYTAGTTQILGGTYGYAVNDGGEVVGQALLNTHANHAFVYANGQFQDLNNLIDPALGWTLGIATAINDQGQIVGSGVSPAGYGRGFLLTPVGSNVPLPATGPAIITIGLAAVCARRLKRQRDGATDVNGSRFCRFGLPHSGHRPGLARKSYPQCSHALNRRRDRDRRIRQTATWGKSGSIAATANSHQGNTKI